MQFTVYDNNTGEPMMEEVFVISESGNLFRLDVEVGEYLTATPVGKNGDYTLQFFPEEADNGNGWRCQKEVY